MSESADLVRAATSLASTVADVTLPLDLPSASPAREVRVRLADQFADHLLPRLRDRGAPLLVVVGGSTGAGKSTLVNTLVGRAVTSTGVLRPTTRSSVLVHHPDDAEAFRSDRVLPSLRRAVATEASVDPDVLTLVASPAVGPGVALLDTPDVDSVAAANRTLSRQLLAAADLWLFVTTPARYADAVPWDLLRTAAHRGTSVAVVLDRVEPHDRREVATHLRSMLDDADLARATLLVVEAVDDLDDQRLPPAAVHEVVDHLAAITGDAAARRAIADATLAGALGSVADRVGVVVDAVDDQVDAVEELGDRVEAAHDHAMETVRTAIEEGRVLRGEVLARWHDFVGAGDFFRRLETGVGRLRDRLSALVRGRQVPEEELAEAVGDGLAAVVVDALQRARRDTIRGWQAGPGAQLVGEVEVVASEAGMQGEVRRLVQSWQDEVVEIVRTQSADKRSSARMLALGLNGVAAALMVAVFASTAGLTGAEVGVAAGTSVVAQRLLEAVLGDQAVRELTAQARDALLRRVGVLVDAQAETFRSRLGRLPVDPAAADRLRAELVELEAARREAGL